LDALPIAAAGYDGYSRTQQTTDGLEGEADALDRRKILTVHAELLQRRCPLPFTRIRRRLTFELRILRVSG
jgi:hypothetical protein